MHENQIMVVLNKISSDFLNNKISIDKLNEILRNEINPLDIYENNLELITTDWYFAVKHLNEIGYETTFEEIEYFIDCYLKKKNYNIDEKNKILRDFYKES